MTQKLRGADFVTRLDQQTYRHIWCEFDEAKKNVNFRDGGKQTRKLNFEESPHYVGFYYKDDFYKITKEEYDKA